MALGNNKGGSHINSDIQNFSSFVTRLNNRAGVLGVQGLAAWSVDALSKLVGFDCAWYGWANISANGVVIHAQETVNLPDDFYDFWSTIADQDLLAARILENREQVACYSRMQKEQTEGMVALSNRYHLDQIATTMQIRPGRTGSFFLSGYRSGKSTKEFSVEEQSFLKCAIDQVSQSMKSIAENEGNQSTDGTVTIYINESGIGLVGIEQMHKKLGEFWPGWNDEFVPIQISQLLDLPGSHILRDRNLVVETFDVPKNNCAGLHKLTLRKLRPADLLTVREKEVSQALVAGLSHKEVARYLGVSPFTVRNQINAIYKKLNVDNRASMTVELGNGI